MKSFVFLFALCFSLLTFSQKKILDHKDFEIWNTIKKPLISPDGKHIMYALEKGEKDRFLKLKNTSGNTVFQYSRGSKGKFTYNSKFAIFTIKPYKDSIISLKKRKVKKGKLPKDSLGIYNINTKSLTKIGNVKSYKIPEKWSGFIAYQFEEIKKKKKKKEKGKSKIKKREKKKVANKKNGFHLVVRDLTTQKQDTFKFVTQYTFAEKGKKLAFATTGKTKKSNSAVYVYNLETNKIQEIYQHRKAEISQLNFSETGNKLSFVADNDSTKVQQRPNELYFWKANNSKAQKLLDNSTAPKGYKVSSNGKVRFSKDEKKLFFGLATPTIIKDTTLVSEEIVNVEVWAYNQPRLYTVQEQQLKKDVKKAYETVIHLDSKKIVQLGTKEYPDIRLTKNANSNYALVRNPKPHQLESQWDGLWAAEVSAVNLTTGERNKILPKTSGYLNISPKGKYIYGYNRIDSTWFTYNTENKVYKTLTKNKRFYREIHDTPTPPRSYGIAGWTKDDNSILIYDRYDIWKFNPKSGENVRLTKGRETKTVYRYVRLDKEEQNIDVEKKWLLLTFNEVNKNSGYYQYNPKTKNGKQLIDKPYKYSRPIKAALADGLIFTRQSFKEFPNIRFADTENFAKTVAISNANPQQENYNWGTIELVDWTSLDGKKLKGLLVKPENFDPTKKYPMIVNFYEKRSDRLNTHWNPYPGRSTINYSFYASRGYLIFNPDIYYKDGKPGESAYNCIIPGIEMLIKKGFVDKNNIGVQGHSWGGYQIAHLVTKTNIFKCAESGAPVANMISAYGGIRWATGLSRNFQYEHTQSRIGGTLWEYPSKYIENSPIFNIDKINTPLLIMHNDKDGHVPWYQGIEFFVALRRLGKPSWFLNYNGEPHWPLKLQNRKDFNIRMAQFFDHYLKGEPKPKWMKRGVPAIEKGIKQGYEFED